MQRFRSECCCRIARQLGIWVLPWRPMAFSASGVDATAGTSPWSLIRGQRIRWQPSICRRRSADEAKLKPSNLPKHVQQACDRVVKAVNHALFQRNDGVVRDVDMLGAHL